MKPEEMAAAYMEELNLSQDEAADALYDEGLIDENERYRLLTDEGRERIDTH